MKVLLTNYHTRAKTTFYRPGYFGRELARRGHDVTVLCTSDRCRRGVTVGTEDSVRFVEAPDLLWGRLRTGWDVWNMANRSRFLSRGRFDLIHAFETRPATIHPVRGYLRRAPTPLVIDWIDWWGRGGLIKEHRPLWYRMLFAGIETFYEERFRTMADATTVISRALGERAAGLGVRRESIFWVPNGCPVEDCAVVPPQTHRSRYGIEPGAFVVADSAMDVTLGIEQALQAVALIARERPETVFLMTGAKEREVRGIAARIGIADRVRHLGILPQADLPKALSCADMFLMVYPDCVANRGRWPGRMGTFLALGRPVVSNPVGEVRLLLEAEKCGVLAEFNPEAMAGAVLALRTDEAAAAEFGARARRVAEGMSWPKMTDRLELAYGFALQARRSDMRASAKAAATEAKMIQ